MVMNNIKPRIIIFVGPSGCGKGTQINLLKSFISKHDSRHIKSIIMGDIFRRFFEDSGYINQVARDLSVNHGKFQPQFLTDALFVDNFIEVFDKDSIFFFDGYPRSIHQLRTLKSLLEYAGEEKPLIINLETSRDNSRLRMEKRNREDDHSLAIENRLNEYEKHVLPLILEARNDDFFEVVDIDGNGTVEETHKNIINKIFEKNGK